MGHPASREAPGWSGNGDGGGGGGGGSGLGDEDGGVVGEGVGEGFADGGLEADAEWVELPGGGSAGGGVEEGGILGGVPGAEFCGDESLADGDAGDECGELGFGGAADAAVGGEVAEPDDVGDAGIVAGQMEEDDVAGEAVDGEPWAELPDPVLVFGGGESVIDAEGLADGVAGFRDGVDVAGGPVGDAAIDDEGADAEVGVCGVGGVRVG